MAGGEKILRSRFGPMVGKASVTIETIRCESTVTVTLEGVILLDQAKALRAFLKSLLNFSARRWILRLENLTSISLRGMLVLAIFAKKIRQRGQVVEIAGIHPAIFEALATFQLLDCFDV